MNNITESENTKDLRKNVVNLLKYIIDQIEGDKVPEDQLEAALGIHASSLRNIGDEIETRLKDLQSDGKEKIALYDYASMLISVFGDNAKIGLCFLMATIFKDIIVKHTKRFPLLFLFGPKGTGKTEMAYSLKSFFSHNDPPLNCQNAPLKTLIDAAYHWPNALVHFDEYKKRISRERQEFLKERWDWSEYVRRKPFENEKNKTNNAGSGVIISGQEMPIHDISFLSRIVLLDFTKKGYSDEERERFQALKNVENQKLTHLTSLIRKYRKEMNLYFEDNYFIAYEDLSYDIEAHVVIDTRNFDNWLILLATYRTLSKYIKLPFDYDELKDICVEGIRRQHGIITKVIEQPYVVR